MKKLLKKKKGFTLIELIVVVAILAILAAVAVPNFIGMTKKATTSTEVAAAAEVANAINIQNTMAKGDSTIYTIVNGQLTATEAAKIITSLQPSIGDVKNPDTQVYPRVTVTGGIATVTNKADIGT